MVIEGTTALGLEQQVSEQLRVACSSLSTPDSKLKIVVSLGNLYEWIGKIVSLNLGKWIRTPLGQMMVFDPVISNSIGIDTENNNIHLANNMHWFASVPWESAQYMEDGLVFRAYINHEVFWLKFALSPEVRDHLARNCELLKITKIHFMGQNTELLTEKHIELTRYVHANSFR